MAPRIARLDSRALISVTGPDARPFLHNLLTQDVETLARGQLRFGGLLSPPGRLLFDLFLLGLEDGVLLDVAADRREALLQRLAMYRLRAQVTVEADDVMATGARRTRPKTTGRPIASRSASPIRRPTPCPTRPIRSRPISTC